MSGPFLRTLGGRWADVGRAFALRVQGFRYAFDGIPDCTPQALETWLVRPAGATPDYKVTAQIRRAAPAHGFPEPGDLAGDVANGCQKVMAQSQAAGTPGASSKAATADRPSLTSTL